MKVARVVKNEVLYLGLVLGSHVSETRAGLCDDAAVVSRMQMYAKGEGLKQEGAQEGLFRVSD